jgi:phage FluMu protein Com
MIRFQCGYCGAILSAPANKAGSIKNCPRCKAVLQVPGGPASAPAPSRVGQRLPPYALRSYLLLAGVVAGLVVLTGGYFLVRSWTSDTAVARGPETTRRDAPPPTEPDPIMPKDHPPELPPEQRGEVEAIIKELNHTDPAVRRQAAIKAQKLGPRARAAVPALVNALKDQSNPVVSPLLRQEAARALGSMGPDADSAVPALRDALQDKNAKVQEEAVEALCKLGKAAVAPLAEALQHPQALIRVRAASGLADLGADARAAVPNLVAALKDTQPDAQVRIAGALLRIDPDNPELVTVFVKALKHPSDIVRGQACESLGNLGVRARGARKDLIDVLSFDINEAVKAKAREALLKIGG